MKFLLRLIASIAAVYISAKVIPGVTVDSLQTTIIVAVVLGVLNMFVKPIFVILTLPITILTLGIFYLMINALMVIITASIVPGFYVESTISALLFGIVVSLTNAFLHNLVD